MGISRNVDGILFISKGKGVVPPIDVEVSMIQPRFSEYGIISLQVQNLGVDL